MMTNRRIAFDIKKMIYKPWFWLVILTIIGSISRIAGLSADPYGLHQDEAFSAYNSWAVMNYGIDAAGDVRPVYYVAWGSGMSVLYSYFTMPLFKLFGVSIWTIRLPQAILGFICIPVAYGLGKELFESEWRALSLAALMAINPWHIQQSRVAIDCCAAVPMLLFAVYFWVRYLNGKRKSIWPAAIFFGLTLYSYALTWVVVPVILLISLIMYRKRVAFDLKLLGAAGLLFLIALPLILFVAVNQGWISEISNGLFTIPKLERARTDEFSFAPWQLKAQFLDLIRLLINQHDERWWISNARVGSFYYISMPFIVIGIFREIYSFVRDIVKKNKMGLCYIMDIWFGIAFVMGVLIALVRYHKINCLLVPMVFYTVVGLITIYDVLKQKKWIVGAFAVIYTLFFGIFAYDHLSFKIDYSLYGDNWNSRMNFSGYDKALDRAKEISDGKVIYVSSLSYPNILLHAEVPPQRFLDTVVYNPVDPGFQFVKGFDIYDLGWYPAREDIIVVYPYEEEEYLLKNGFTVEHSDTCYGVAYKTAGGN